MKETKFGRLSALTLASTGKPKGALVLLHGVGSIEQNILELGPMIAPDRMIIALRAPLELGENSFGWFHVQFTVNGPVHNWEEAEESFHLIEEALKSISLKAGIPLENISVFGFSQGTIMTIGLALQSKLSLEKYIAASGRTLPEFANTAKNSPLPSYCYRNIFVAHGEHDSKLPVSMGRNTEKVLMSAGLNLTYKEYPVDHAVSQDEIEDLKEWFSPK